MATTPELIQIDVLPKRPQPKPEWLKARAPMGEVFHDLKKAGTQLEPEHGMRVGALPQYRRMLEP